jgi:two-component system, NarL family, invasion response regulator UvrY
MATNKLILLADDHVIIRRGLKVILDNYFEKEVLIEADSTKEILSKLAEFEVTHMILDMQLIGSNVIDILPDLVKNYPHIPILIYTMSSEEIFGARLLQMGARGFLSKQTEETEVVRALDLFFQGQTYVSNALQDILSDKKLATKINPLLSLSERELSVMGHLLKGESVKDIAIYLNLKATTIATYKARIFQKTGVDNIIDLRNITDLYNAKGS